MDGEFRPSLEQQAALDAYDEMVRRRQQGYTEQPFAVEPRPTINEFQEDQMIRAEQRDAKDLTFMERTRS